MLLVNSDEQRKGFCRSNSSEQGMPPEVKVPKGDISKRMISSGQEDLQGDISQDEVCSASEIKVGGECFKHFSIEDGYLLYKGRVCIPFANGIRYQILKECHNIFSAHNGALVKRGFLLIWSEQNSPILCAQELNSSKSLKMNN